MILRIYYPTCFKKFVKFDKVLSFPLPWNMLFTCPVEGNNFVEWKEYKILPLLNGKKLTEAKFQIFRKNFASQIHGKKLDENYIFNTL